MSEELPTLTVAVLGAGTVGSQVIRYLHEEAADLAQRSGARLDLGAVVVRDLGAERPTWVPRHLLTADGPGAIDHADLVIELIGGIEPARTWVLRALRRGASVVTGNKALLASHGPELYQAAAVAGADLYYEASVAGAVPVVYGLRESLAGDRVNRVAGIVNGTTNYILDRMGGTGASYAEALAEAQRQGFAEADPTADVSGRDAAAKCAILASLAFHTRVGIEDVEVEGIEGVSVEDIAEAAFFDRSIKLLAVAERRSGPDGREGVSASVHPALVPAGHPLANVHGAYNAVLTESDAAGRLMFYGLGAGGAPTASAVLGDVVAAASHRVHGGNAPRESWYAKLPILDPALASSRCQIRLAVRDRLGVLSEVAGIFARHGLSIESVHQREDGRSGVVQVVVVTHAAPVSDQRATRDALARSEAVVRVESAYRIEEN